MPECAEPAWPPLINMNHWPHQPASRPGHWAAHFQRQARAHGWVVERPGDGNKAACLQALLMDMST